MELRQLRYAIAVADELNFTRAAEKLSIAQPALSQQIQSLERVLGFELFDRSQKRISLTEPGRQFVAEARDLILQAERVRETGRRAALGQEGQLRLGFMGFATSPFLADLVQEFRTRFPKVSISLHDLAPEEQIRKLAAEELDAGFCRSAATGRGPRFGHEEVYRDRFHVATCDRCALACRNDVELHELANMPMVLYDRSRAPKMIDDALELCERAGFQPRIAAVTDNMQSLALLVAAGVGYAIVPGCLRFLGQPGFILHPISSGGLDLPVDAIWPQAGHRPIVQNWINLVREKNADIRRVMEPVPAG